MRYSDTFEVTDAGLSVCALAPLQLLMSKMLSQGKHRISTPQKEHTPPSSLNSSKLRDLSSARLERKRHQTLSESRSSDNLETASRVHKVASAWSQMKQRYKARSAQTSLTELPSAPALRLVSVIKATSSPGEPLSGQVSAKKILFKKKAGSPARAAAAQQGDTLLTKLLQFKDALEKKPRQVIEVSFVPSKPKEEKRKPRVIEVSMASRV